MPMVDLFITFELIIEQYFLHYSYTIDLFHCLLYIDFNLQDLLKLDAEIAKS